MNEPAIDEEEVEPRFLLVSTELVETDVVAAVLAALQPAALVVGAGWAGRLAEIKPIAHDHGTALLADDDLDLALEIDGIHLTDPRLVSKVRSALDDKSRDRLILGADIGLSRHDAMVAGEMGADYVAFGEHGQSADETIIELVAWWRDVTVMPCLAYAEDADAVAKLAATSADFIGISGAIWKSPHGPLVAAEALNAAIRKN